MTKSSTEYQVLARKYRPTTLSELIGQDVLVQTLSNAITQDRVPHAFIMTGIRGVGKTSTARIIARSLCCTGENNENEKPVIEPCGVCDNCSNIALGRHVDIIEIDAASNTGVDNIRELIESSHFAPAMSRYKIYIIDEVHMLSKAAFNALLKTLEEPPAHIKFILATTEIDKVPVTILSRCMRFDLARINVANLTSHFTNITEKEGYKISESASSQIAKAAEGSVRDGLSLLDQALSTLTGGEELSEEQVEAMLGLSNQLKSYELMEKIISLDAETVLNAYREQYNAGANPVAIINRLLEITHFLTQFKIIKNFGEICGAPQAEIEFSMKLLENTDIAQLSRIWQILSKGLEEIKIHPNQAIAVEMVLVRLVYSIGLPTAGEILNRLDNSPASAEGIQKKNILIVNDNQPSTPAPTDINSFNDLLELCNYHRDYFLKTWLEEVSVNSFDGANKALNIGLANTSPKDLPTRIIEFLKEHLNQSWQVDTSEEKQEKSIRENQEEKRDKMIADAKSNPRVTEILEKLNGTEIADIYSTKTGKSLIN